MQTSPPGYVIYMAKPLEYIYSLYKSDSYRYTTAGTFSAPYHYIDALDSPPTSCSVDYARDCGVGGCVVSAISNYVNRSDSCIYLALTKAF